MRDRELREWRMLVRQRADADWRELSSDVIDELACHLADLYAAARRNGTNEQEARRAALDALTAASFRELSKRPRARHLPGGYKQDIRLAFRQLSATPIVTLVAILSLALGIGANTAIFSLVDGLLLRSLPVKEADRLVVLVEPSSGRGRGDFGDVPMPVRYAVWNEIRQQPQLFDGAIAWSSTRFNLAAGGEAQLVNGLWASDSFFDLLGVPAVIGRTFSDRDRVSVPLDKTAEPVAVISYGLWQRRFGGAADAIGRSLMLDTLPFTIIGVTSPEFFGVEVGRSFDVIVPLGVEPLAHGLESWLRPGNLASPLRVIARLRPGQTFDAATAALRGVQPQIRERTMPDSWPAPQRDRYLQSAFTLVPTAMAGWNLRRQYERPLLTIMVVVVLVLLIACGNVANLLLARATARQYELSVRRALGASRWRLVRQLLAESVVLAAIATAAGLLVARWGSHLLIRQISTDVNPVFLDLSMNIHVLLFTSSLAVATILIFGVAPACRAARIQPMAALRKDSRSTSGERRTGLATGLVIAQVALSLVLVVTSGLFVQTFTSLARRELGFDPTRVIVVNINSQRTHIPPPERAAVYERARDAVRRLPGVTAAGVASLTPIVSGPMLGQPIEEVSGGEPPPRQGPGQLSALNLISAGWLDALGTHVIAGRDVSDRDRRGTTPVAIVNEAFARKFLKGANPVGHTVKLLLPGPPPPPVEIVGLVADAVYGSLRNPPPATIFLPIAQLSDVALPFLASVNIIVRVTGGPPTQLIRSIAGAVGGVSPELALTFRTLNDQIDESMTQERILAMLSGFFGALALLLAGLGLYGVTSYAVNRRKTEIGIRMALGAAPSGVVRLVVSGMSILVGMGIVLGVGLSAWASKFVASLLYGLQPNDPVTLVGATVMLAGVSGVATLVPAYRASRIDPAQVLRDS